MVYYYNRVQDVEKNMNQPKGLGVSIDLVLSDKYSESRKSAPAINRLKRISKDGDVIYCESISALSCSAKGLIDSCDYFIGRGVKLFFVKEGIDISNENQFNFLKTLFSEVGQMEQLAQRERSRNGVKKCKETGQTKSGEWFGRKEVDKEFIITKYPEFPKYYEMIKNNEMSKTEASRLLGVGRTTIYNYLDIYAS